MNSIKLHFLNVGHGDCTIIEHESGRLTMIDINNSTTLPDADEIALAENKGLSLGAFKASSLTTRSWEDYYKGKLVDPIEYWRANFSGRSLFRYIQTHPDMDHMGGLAGLFWTEKVHLENFWDIEHSKTHVEADFNNGGPHNWVDWLAYKVLRGGSYGPDGEHKVHKKERGHAGEFWTSDGLTILSPTTELADYCDRI